MTLHDVIAAYLAELVADGIRDPLGESFVLAAVIDDLCRLADVPVPLAVAAHLMLAAGEPAPAA